MKRTQLILMCLLTLFVTSCSKQEETSPDPEVPEAGDAVELGSPDEMEPVPSGQTEEEEPESTETSPVTLDIKSWEETQALIAASKGKIVIVDLWATYCGPCLVELPNLVQIHKEHGDQVECISVSLDYQGFEDQPVESYKEPVLAVLKEKGATFQNLLCSTDSDTMYNEKLTQGSIPVVYVYDQSGELAAQFPDPENPAEFTYQADIMPVVMNLLK
ncbi:TlpA family protein disulfide reductase [Planctomicrobium sp.]|jgi:thiol-disulfide isomerase/thioredoxin|nr:TlpA family protein disulfide reductase [Planctomicrobium sp.]MDA7503954.1 TlpA family protein disulfide reductase [bacterium]MDB4439566.1 TlpA family protein disulfide reductase [Planctomicrobium sp.]MDB4731607.1 TlpA family protein disulfide reductase [bacterium]